MVAKTLFADYDNFIFKRFSDFISITLSLKEKMIYCAQLSADLAKRNSLRGYLPSHALHGVVHRFQAPANKFCNFLTRVTIEIIP